MTAQNVYDDPAFFAGYEELRRTGAGLNEVLEQPALERLLPSSLEGLRVLDLGCGFGDFARKARRLGARSVVGGGVRARETGQEQSSLDNALQSGSRTEQTRSPPQFQQPVSPEEFDD